MNLRDAISFHQLVLASEGRTEATQRQYLWFERAGHASLAEQWLDGRAAS